MVFVSSSGLLHLMFLAMCMYYWNIFLKEHGSKIQKYFLKSLIFFLVVYNLFLSISMKEQEYYFYSDHKHICTNTSNLVPSIESGVSIPKISFEYCELLSSENSIVRNENIISG